MYYLIFKCVLVILQSFCVLGVIFSWQQVVKFHTEKACNSFFFVCLFFNNSYHNTLFMSCSLTIWTLSILTFIICFRDKSKFNGLQEKTLWNRKRAMEISFIFTPCCDQIISATSCGNWLLLEGHLSIALYSGGTAI